MPSSVVIALLQSLHPDTREAVDRVALGHERVTVRQVSNLVAAATAHPNERPDLLVVDRRDRGARASAAAASLLGLPVTWVGDGAMRSVGAPVVPCELFDDVALDATLTAVHRAGVAVGGGPNVSVIVTTLNEGSALAGLLVELATQMRADDECVVVDGGSTDDCVVLARAMVGSDPRFRIEISPGAGISEGRNIGIRLARHDHLVCTDAGCHPAADWLGAMRQAFDAGARPGLVSGAYQVSHRDRLEQAQALACYPDEWEARHPDVTTRLYTRLFGTAFDPRFCVGRCVGFTREAWESVGGFPEHLPTGEDVTFGLAVSRAYPVVGATDARLVWDQRGSLLSTWKMYRNYGRSSADGGNVKLLIRDGIRGAAYVLVPALMLDARGRRVVAAGAAAYQSVPVRRALRAGAPASVLPFIPVAMATKDLGKLAGAVQGFARARGWMAAR
ncbi:glycosyltransferase [Arsenicicoccus cauae]|uniref:glycosyltransferase n=1 Tax=Arsenicicoccus cauae TaxID=2663847 RepID=UPI00370D91C2